MSRKSKLAFAAALAVIGLLSIPLLQPLISPTSQAPSPHPANSASGISSPAEPTAAPFRTRRPRLPAKEWKLPFRLKPRLTPEQLGILDRDPAGHLREDPDDIDVLIGWATRDPDAAIAWLKSVGNFTVDDTSFYESHLAAICAGLLAHGGIEEMLAYLKQHEQDPLLPPKYHDGAFNDQIWYKLAREDTAQEAIAYLKDHPDETVLAGAFISGIADTRQMLAAMDYFQLKGIESNVDYWVLRDRMHEDQNLFADWAATSRPDMLEEILLGWHSDNPQQLQQWINTNAGRPELAKPIREIRDFIAKDVPPAAAGEDDGDEEE